ncbi:MAG TPA: hypothetical protein VKU19_38485 [Bryobacteraceae bacterium]|nr:hypothetical protein [Bryobacteraceae bacterium]
MGPTRRLQAVRIGVVVLALGAFVAAILAKWITTERPLEVTSTTPLTGDGMPKSAPIFTDGEHVYFIEIRGGRYVLFSVTATGSGLHRLELPFPQGVLLDIASGTRFLVRAPNSRGEVFLWTWTPGQDPKALGATRADDGAFGSESEVIELFQGTGTGTTARIRWTKSGKEMPVPLANGLLNHPHWSNARHVVRFTSLDYEREASALWEAAPSDVSPHRLDAYPPRSSYGRWSLDGRLFVFLAHDQSKPEWQGQSDIWAADERLFPYQIQKPPPVRLTHGPTNYLAAIPSIDGKRIFALGKQEHGELVRFDQRAGVFLPFARPLWAMQTDYSRDGKWIAYVRYPERTLWKMRPDGSDQVQLTTSHIGVHGPHWSPDGSRIAFMGEPALGRYRLYVVPASGGEPKELAPFDTADQGIPTWAPDGQRIVFGELLNRKPTSEMSVQLLNLATNSLERLPGSRGVWTPRWSPDGRQILGISSDQHRLVLFNWTTRTWQDLTTFVFISDPSWSADSTHIYFVGRNQDLSDRAYYRTSLPSNKLERILDLSSFEAAEDEWFGVTPDGTPLAVKSSQVTEIYALELRR